MPQPKLWFPGNTFATKDTAVIGGSIEQNVPKGQIKSDELNTTTYSEDFEFSIFEETIKDYILARLGHPVVRVELTPFQIKTCIDEAVTHLHYHAPLWTKQMASFIATGGTNTYELPRFILDNLEYVVYKKSLLSVQSQAGTLEFDFFIKYFQDNFLFREFAIGDFFLLQQNLEMIRKVLGQEGTWDVINNRYLQLYPTPPINEVVILEYRALDSDTLHPAYRNWIQKYATACAKGILGEIRGKYSTLPSPGGGATLNGPALVQASTQEKEELYQKLLEELEEPPAFTVF